MVTAMYGVSAFSLQPVNDRFIEVNSKKTIAVPSSASLHTRGHKISLNPFPANLGLSWKGLERDYFNLKTSFSNTQ